MGLLFMKKKYLCAGLIILLFQTKTAFSRNSCYECHLKLSDEKMRLPAENWRKSVHSSANVLCSDCHGGNPSIEDESAMDESKGFKGIPSRRDIPEMCGRCHSDPERMKVYNIRTDQLSEYKTSQHGRLLYEKNDQKVAVCSDCHRSHDILRKIDPSSPVHKFNIPQTCAKCHANREYMKDYGIPTDQFEKYSRSIHGMVLSGKFKEKNANLAPACSDCHGIHGAIPPEVKEISEVCGICHGIVADYFKRSPHYSALLEGMGPRCVDCHGHHDIEASSTEMFSMEKGICSKCHNKESPEASVIESFYKGLSTGQAISFEIEQSLEKIKNSGRYVEDLFLEFAKAKNDFIKARSLTHTLDPKEVFSYLTNATSIMEEIRKKIKEIEEEVKYRKKFGLTVDILLIFLVTILLGLRWHLKKEKIEEIS